MEGSRFQAGVPYHGAERRAGMQGYRMTHMRRRAANVR
jgi:hypothetical protein